MPVTSCASSTISACPSASSTLTPSAAAQIVDLYKVDQVVEEGVKLPSVIPKGDTHLAAKFSKLALVALFSQALSHFLVTSATSSRAGQLERNLLDGAEVRERPVELRGVADDHD